MIRAFIAVELGDTLRTLLLQLQQELKRRLRLDSVAGVRLSWVQPASIHLTVKFLGDVDELQIEPLRAACAVVAPSHAAMTIPIERIGAFPHPQQPRVLWAGPSVQWELSEDAKRVDALHQAVNGCCQSLGIPLDERPLNPHLTLARVKGGERLVGQALLKSGVMDRPLSLDLSVGSLALMKSELRPAGSLYTKLWEIRLSNRSPF